MRIRNYWAKIVRKGFQHKKTYQNPNYKRHDEVGWNYRLSEILAAVALGQLEGIEEKVRLRQEVAKTFLKEITDANPGDMLAVGVTQTIKSYEKLLRD